MAELSKKLDSIIKTRSSFDSFKNQFTKAFPNFFKTLINMHPTLSPTDLQLCAYIKMNQTNQDIASINNISTRSVESQRYRLRKKLNIDKQLLDKINKFAPIKHILKNKPKNDNQVIELLNDISKDLFNHDLELRIQELESKFSEDLSETTFNQIKELKNERKIN